MVQSKASKALTSLSLNDLSSTIEKSERFNPKGKAQMKLSTTSLTNLIAYESTMDRPSIMARGNETEYAC